MANKVFANTREIACKAAAGKTICAFPDVCFTPPDKVPPTPPGVPIPYPNTGMASDTTKGSKKVMISDKEIILKNKSYFKKSTGDEAGCATKKGVITSKTTGKVYFQAWSMDVKIEGMNAARHLDLTTNNHASAPGDTPPWPYLDSASVTADSTCREEKKKVAKACNPEKEWKKNCPVPPPDIGKPPEDKTSQAYRVWQGNNKARLELFDDYSKNVKENPCLRARKCMLVSKKDASKTSSKRECCPGQTGHHLIEGASFRNQPGWGGYDYDAAPTVCAEGPSWHTGSHRDLHLLQGSAALNTSSGGRWPRKKATKAGAKALTKAFPGSGCSKKCIEAQLNNYHDNIPNVPSPEPDLKASVNTPDDPILKGTADAIMGFN